MPTVLEQLRIDVDRLRVDFTALNNSHGALQMAHDALQGQCNDLTARFSLFSASAVIYGSEIRFGVENQPVIIGTSCGSAVVGTVVDVGVEPGNDNWFKVLRRP
jgi:hypothetical protein